MKGFEGLSHHLCDYGITSTDPQTQGMAKIHDFLSLTFHSLFSP